MTATTSTTQSTRNTIQSQRTTAITYDIACKLRDGLNSITDGHSLISYEQACRCIHEAGLSTCLLPMRASARSTKWTLQLAVIDRWPEDSAMSGREVFYGEAQILRPYLLCELKPVTEYLGDLMTCNLARPWWAAPGFVSSLRRLLVPTPSRASRAWGRGQEARETHQIFLEDFAQRIHPDTSIEPAVELDVRRLRFFQAIAQPEYAIQEEAE